jgi:hypothetical protein
VIGCLKNGRKVCCFPVIQTPASLLPTLRGPVKRFFYLY